MGNYTLPVIISGWQNLVSNIIKPTNWWLIFQNKYFYFDVKKIWRSPKNIQKLAVFFGPNLNNQAKKGPIHHEIQSPLSR